tara:strand:+ start:357 stop:827 length:471 start_codon:yes stop_codon:yes gene_type:complete
MSTKDRVFSRLFDSQKHNLNTNLTKEHKVALSLVSEIETLVSDFEPAESEASYLAYDYADEIINKITDYRSEIGEIDDYIINGNARGLEGYTLSLSEKLDDLEVKANELGIDPNDILSGFNDIKQRVDNAFSLNNAARAKYKEVVEYSGFLNDFWN